MFALKEIVKNKLYAVKTTSKKDAFQECFSNWANPLFLYHFFKDNKDCLAFYRLTDIKEAASRVIEEARNFENDILEIAENKSQYSLDNIVFEPLHEKDDFDLPLIETKAYGIQNNKSFLRLYAIRLKDGSYIVVGGLIKTSKSLQETKEGKAILRKLKQLVQYLRESDMYDAFDIGIIII